MALLFLSGNATAADVESGKTFSAGPSYGAFGSGTTIMSQMLQISPNNGATAIGVPLQKVSIEIQKMPVGQSAFWVFGGSSTAAGCYLINKTGITTYVLTTIKAQSWFSGMTFQMSGDTVIMTVPASFAGATIRNEVMRLPMSPLGGL